MKKYYYGTLEFVIMLMCYSDPQNGYYARLIQKNISHSLICIPLCFVYQGETRRGNN